MPGLDKNASSDAVLPIHEWVVMLIVKGFKVTVPQGLPRFTKRFDASSTFMPTICLSFIYKRF